MTRSAPMAEAAVRATVDAPASGSPSWSRPGALELGLAACVLALGIAARAWAFQGLGINHYDEGVYAISAAGLLESPIALFPNQIVFSPPFFFAMAALAHWILGLDADRAAIVVNIVLGSASVAAVWLVARAWFGARVAAISATMLAFSPMHVLLSRVALTDVAFSFWFVLALGATVLAVNRGDYRAAVLAGLLTGIAWNTKYHGWFVLLITGVALLPELGRALRRRGPLRPLMVWGAVAVVAGLCYLPWALYMGAASSDGGYGGIVRYFAAMLRGEWLANVVRHAGQQMFMEGALSRAAPLAALGAGLLVQDGSTTRRVAITALVMAAGGLLFGQVGLAVALGLLAIPILREQFESYRTRVVICWVGLWVVAAPFYHPYARLLLPFLIAAFLLAGLAVNRLLGSAESKGESRTEGRGGFRSLTGAGVLVVVASIVVALVAPIVRQDYGNPWRATRDLAAVALEIAERVPANEPIYVIGEPPLAHYLRALGREVPGDLRPRALAALTGPAHVVTGIYSKRAPPLQNVLSGFGERLSKEGVLIFEPNDLRLLDDLPPGPARAYRRQRNDTFDLTFYRLAPVEPGVAEGTVR